MRRGNAFSASVCLSVCPVRVVTFKCPDLQILFLVHRYNFGISGSRSSIKSQGQGNTSVNKYTNESSGRQSCYNWRVKTQN